MRSFNTDLVKVPSAVRIVAGIAALAIGLCGVLLIILLIWRESALKNLPFIVGVVLGIPLVIVCYRVSYHQRYVPQKNAWRLAMARPEDIIFVGWRDDAWPISWLKQGLISQMEPYAMIVDADTEGLSFYSPNRPATPLRSIPWAEVTTVATGKAGMASWIGPGLAFHTSNPSNAFTFRVGLPRSSGRSVADSEQVSLLAARLTAMQKHPT